VALPGARTRERFDGEPRLGLDEAPPHGVQRQRDTITQVELLEQLWRWRSTV
jgi:hypothetical protein